MTADLFPHILIVSRRTVRKNKFVDFVGEYHLDLIVRYGAVPVILPRVYGIDKFLDSFQPIHGVLLCEVEDINPSLHENETSTLSPEELEEIKNVHASDTAIDNEKDLIELKLAKLCLERGIPYLGICRGSQILNVACGGTLYQDIGTELSKKFPNSHSVNHINYDDYDGHRHMINVVENTPLHYWFKDSMEKEDMEILVNSYHHQGVKRLGKRFVPMAFAHDGLIEGFYDPEAYNPQEGKFTVGLQFHPERMRLQNSHEFDYPGCAIVYQEFVKAVIAYQKKVSSSSYVPNPVPLKKEKEKSKIKLVRSFSLAKEMHSSGRRVHPTKESELEAVEEFLESKSNAGSGFQQDQMKLRLMQMGATVRNSSSYMRMKLNEDKEILARNIRVGSMSIGQLSNLMCASNA